MDRLSSANRVAGIKQTRNAVITGTAAVVYAAEDAEPAMIDEIIGLCGEHGVEVVRTASRKELAKACRIEVPCAVAAVLK